MNSRELNTLIEIKEKIDANPLIIDDVMRFCVDNLTKYKEKAKKQNDNLIRNYLPSLMQASVGKKRMPVKALRQFLGNKELRDALFPYDLGSYSAADREFYEKVFKDNEYIDDEK